MVEKKMVINGIRRIALILANQLFLINEKNLLIIFDNNGKAVFNSNGLEFHLNTLIQGKLILSDLNYGVNINKEIIFLKNISTQYWNIGVASDNGVVFFADEENGVFYNVIEDVSVLTVKPVWKDRSPFKIGDSYLLCRGDNSITCHPLSTGEEKWRLDFNALLGVSDAALYGDIFEHQGRIYFYLSNALSSAESMYCVSIETGEVLQKIAGFGGFRVQRDKDILYDMRDYTLQMLHLDSLEMTKRDFSTILQPLDWQSNGTDKFLVKEDKIYFIGQARKDNIMLVEVDMNTEQIISKTDIGSNQFLINEIRAEGNRIYLLKDNRELLIYEK